MKKTGLILLSALLSGAVLSGCTEAELNYASSLLSQMAAGTELPAEPAAETEPSEEDRLAAAQAAALIDAIYVQERTQETDAQCEEARKAWDALTEEQKALVEGEEADPDYFGRDTGDASKDDPLNADGIGETELLVVSFGTSFNESRVQDISGIEKSLAEAFPGLSVRRAFTSQIIINHVQARDGEKIDNMDQALERAAQNGVKHLLVQPTHLMHGAEYDELTGALERYRDRFESVTLAEPLLGEVGKDETESNADKKTVAEAVVKEAFGDAGFDGAPAAAAEGTALVLMGHGTSHTARVTYSQMQTQMDELGYGNVFIGTVEGEPEDTACSVVLEKVKDAGFSRVILRPFMVVAGDHANNDMAGDEEDSWKSMFEASGAFKEVVCQIEGLGRIPEIQAVYAAHTAEALEEPEGNKAAPAEVKKDGSLSDGDYSVKVDTDSSMFHLNEAKEGRGELHVKDGEMTVHIVMPSKNILHLFAGTAKEAQESGAVLLDPLTEEVTFPDGTKEEAYAFDLPVPALEKDFPVAIIGTKGKWYDHTVRVSDPVEK